MSEIYLTQPVSSQVPCSDNLDAVIDIDYYAMLEKHSVSDIASLINSTKMVNHEKTNNNYNAYVHDTIKR